MSHDFSSIPLIGDVITKNKSISPVQQSLIKLPYNTNSTDVVLFISGSKLLRNTTGDLLTHEARKIPPTEVPCHGTCNRSKHLLIVNADTILVINVSAEKLKVQLEYTELHGNFITLYVSEHLEDGHGTERTNKLDAQKCNITNKKE